MYGEHVIMEGEVAISERAELQEIILEEEWKLDTSLPALLRRQAD